jgi:hypothetical protein
VIDREVAVPDSKPVLDVPTVMVDAVAGLIPTTVIRPVASMVAVAPNRELTKDHVKEEL